MVYNGDGTQHKEAMNLSSIVPVVNSRVQEHRHKSFYRNEYEKEKYDYISALRLCAEVRPRYVVVFQDDVVPYAGLLPNLRYLLSHHLPKSREAWVVLKLFFPEKWTSWSVEEVLVRSLVVGLILTALSLLVIVVSPSRTSGRKRVRVPTCTCTPIPVRREKCAVLSFVVRAGMSVAFALCLLLSASKPHVLELRRASSLLHYTTEATRSGT